MDAYMIWVLDTKAPIKCGLSGNDCVFDKFFLNFDLAISIDRIKMFRFFKRWIEMCVCVFGAIVESSKAYFDTHSWLKSSWFIA